MIAVKNKIKEDSFKDKYREGLIDIIFDAYSEHPEYGEHSRKSAKRYINWLKNHSTLFDVVLDNDKPVAFIVADGNWISSFSGDNVGEIHELAIRKSYWGKGLGKYLMNKALKHFKELNLKKAGLWVGEKNKRAIEFYKKYGFKTVRKYNQWVRMERNL